MGTGLDLGNAVRAGFQLDAEVANFHDDKPGMLGSNYQVSIDWGDGTSTGQAWNAGGGNWVATGSHTYAEPGHYDVSVTIADMHAATGMTATAYSTVEVAPGAAPGSGQGRRLAEVATARAVGFVAPVVSVLAAGTRSPAADRVAPPLPPPTSLVEAWLTQPDWSAAHRLGRAAVDDAFGGWGHDPLALGVFDAVGVDLSR